MSFRSRGQTDNNTSTITKHTLHPGLCADKKVKKVKEADLYSTFIEVPYTQGAQVRITQCYLQTTPYLPLPRKHSPDSLVNRCLTALSAQTGYIMLQE